MVTLPFSFVPSGNSYAASLISHATCLLPTCCPGKLKTKSALKTTSTNLANNEHSQVCIRWKLTKTEAKLATNGTFELFLAAKSFKCMQATKTWNCRRVCQLAKKCKPTANKVWPPQSGLENASIRQPVTLKAN